MTEAQAVARNRMPEMAQSTAGVESLPSFTNSARQRWESLSDFFHEPGHILLHGKKALFLEGINGLDPEKENEANEFAANELISGKVLLAFAQGNRLS